MNKLYWFCDPSEFKVYANPDCEECLGDGCYMLIEDEAWGDTWVGVPKGYKACPSCAMLKLDGVRFIYWEPVTRMTIDGLLPVPF